MNPQTVLDACDELTKDAMSNELFAYNELIDKTFGPQLWEAIRTEFHQNLSASNIKKLSNGLYRMIINVDLPIYAICLSGLRESLRHTGYSNVVSPSSKQWKDDSIVIHRVIFPYRFLDTLILDDDMSFLLFLPVVGWIIYGANHLITNRLRKKKISRETITIDFSRNDT